MRRAGETLGSSGDGALLNVVGLSKSFGGLRAVHGLDFRVAEGKIVGLIGPNGAGKTTVFNLIHGVIQPDGGSITFRGRNMVGLRPHQVATLGIGRTFQQSRLFTNLSVLENAMVGRHCRTRAEFLGAIFRGARVIAEERQILQRAQELLEFVGLARRQHDLARNLAYGHQRLLEIARAIATDPLLLLVDEPTSGLTISESQEVMGLLSKIRARGISLFVIEHHMNVIMNLADRIVVLNHGSKIFEGTPEATQRSPQVIAAYLGEELE